MLPVLLFIGCDPTSEQACATAAAAGPALTVGTGESEFEGLQDGDEVSWVYGSQGGFHVWGSLRVNGIVQGTSDNLEDPDNPLVSFVLVDGETEVAGFHDLRHHFTTATDGTMEYLGDRLIFYETDQDYLTGLSVVMRASLVDACGTELTAETALVLTGEAGDGAE